MINTIGIQEAWEAAGGNPGIKATKAELIEALNSLDEACDAIRDNAGPQGAVPLTRYGIQGGIQGGATLQPMNDGYWTPWHVADLVIAGMREEQGGLAGAVPMPQFRCPMNIAPRDGSVIILHWGEDQSSPGWWSAPVSPVKNEDSTYPDGTIGWFPWSFIDWDCGRPFVNKAVETEYGPTGWSVYGINDKPKHAHEAAAPHALRAKLRSCEEALAAAEAREAAACGVPAMNKAEAYRAIKRALGDAIADDAEISIHDLTRCVVEAIPQQPTAEGTCSWRCAEASECDGSCAPVAVTAEPAVREAAGPQHEQGGA